LGLLTQKRLQPKPDYDKINIWNGHLTGRRGAAATPRIDCEVKTIIGYRSLARKVYLFQLSSGGARVARGFASSK
jgi:hypothetical protein